MKGKIAVLFLGILVLGVVASGCIGGKPTETTSPTVAKEVELTGNLEQDVVSIGKVLEQNGISEVKFSAWSGGD
ncbi:ABC transporter substrate-binding protein, partial [Thermococci archaeon]